MGISTDMRGRSKSEKVEAYRRLGVGWPRLLLSVREAQLKEKKRNKGKESNRKSIARNAARNAARDAKDVTA